MEVSSDKELWEALRNFAHRLASWSPLESSFTPTQDGSPELLLAIGQIINALNEDWKTRLLESHVEGERRTLDLSRAYEALQVKSEEMNRDLETARRIQLQLLPQGPEIPLRDELRFSASYHSVDRVGGDLYDLIRIGKNAYALLIADVSGHGLPSALITMLVKAAFRTRVRWGVATDAVCREVNTVLHPIVNELGFFVTAFFGILDLETSTLRYTNCGHNPAVLYHRARNDVVLLDTPGMILGPLEDVDLEEGITTLEPGDLIIAYTDGITEARNFMDDLYGETRLINLIRKYALLKKGADLPKIIVEAVTKDLRNFSMGAPQADDQSLAVLQFQCSAEDTHTGEPTDKELLKQKRNRALIQNLNKEARKAYKEKHYPEAEAILKALIALYPEHNSANLLLAMTLFKLGKKQECREWAAHALNLAGEVSRVGQKASQILRKIPHEVN